MLELAMTQILFSVVGLIAGFILGNISGWYLRGRYKCPEGQNCVVISILKKPKRTAMFFINIIIVTLWTISVANTIFQFNDANTPIFLHGMMGATMGYLNEGFGKYIMDFFGKVPKNKDVKK